MTKDEKRKAKKKAKKQRQAERRRAQAETDASASASTEPRSPLIVMPQGEDSAQGSEARIPYEGKGKGRASEPEGMASSTTTLVGEGCEDNEDCEEEEEDEDEEDEETVEEEDEDSHCKWFITPGEPVVLCERHGTSCAEMRYPRAVGRCLPTGSRLGLLRRFSE